MEAHPRENCQITQSRGGAGDELTLDIRHEEGQLFLGFRPWSKDDGEDIRVALEADQRRRVHWSSAAAS